MILDNLDKMTWSMDGRGSGDGFGDDILRELRGLLDSGDLDSSLRSFLHHRAGDIRIYRRDPNAWTLGIVLVGGPAHFAGILLKNTSRLWGFLGETEGSTFRSHHDGPVRGALEWAVSVAKSVPGEEVHDIISLDDRRPYDSFAQIAKAFLFEQHANRRSPARLHAPDTSAIFDPWPIMQTLPMAPLKPEEEDPTQSNANVMRYLGPFPGKLVRHFVDRVFVPPRPAGHDIFITLEVEKRTWLEQHEGVVRFIEAAADVNPHVGSIVFNGMTAPYGGVKGDFFPEVRQVELQVIEDIRKHIPRRLNVVSLFGMSLAEKMERATGCGFFLAPCGSGSLVPLVMGMPGILYQNTTFIKWNKGFDPPEARRISAGMIEDRPEVESLRKHAPRSQTMSYSIDPEAFVAFAMEWYHQKHSRA